MSYAPAACHPFSNRSAIGTVLHGSANVQLRANGRLGFIQTALVPGMLDAGRASSNQAGNQQDGQEGCAQYWKIPM